MNILLTGGAGYIGSHAAVVLSQAGHEIVLFDNVSNSRPEGFLRLQRILGKPLVCVEGDIRDTHLLCQTLQEHAVQAVVHFAGLKAVGDSVTQPLNYYANNVQGSVSLLQAMQAGGARTLVFSSSATVYCDPQYLPYDEAHPTCAINPYGRTKLYIEEMLKDVAASDASWRIACLRYFNPVGAHESGLIGEDPQGVPNNLMPYLAQVANGQRPYLNVFGNDYSTPDGTGVRDYIHVVDLAEGHLATLDFLGRSGNEGWHAINLGTGEGTSVLEMVQAFKAANGRSIPYKISPRRQGDLPAFYAKTDKAQRLLGWQARRSLHDMCASTWHWQQHSEFS